MNDGQDWQTESYKGMDVHVTALARADGRWDYTVRVAQPGENTEASGDLAAMSGDDGDYPSQQAAVEAGFAKGYAMVDDMTV